MTTHSRRLTVTKRALDIRFETNADIAKSGCNIIGLRGGTCVARRRAVGGAVTRSSDPLISIPIPVPIPNPGNIIQHLVKECPREVEPGGETGKRGGEIKIPTASFNTYRW